MSDHVDAGSICIIGIGNGSGYDEYQGYIRAITSVPGGESEPTINATYSDGIGGATQINVLENIEHADLGINDDYWRAQLEENLGDSQPFANTRPVQGQILWVGIYDATEGEYFHHLGIVRAVLGAPTDQEPSLALSYYDKNDNTDNNANSVVPFSEAGSTDDYWADFSSQIA